MTLSEKIVHKYPVSTSYTVSAPQSVFLSYEDETAQCHRSALERVLREDMSVILEQDAGYQVIGLQIGSVTAGSMTFLRLRHKDASFYFDPRHILRDMPWVIRALADKASWLKDCEGRIIRVQTYSARQQVLAMKFLQECRRQLTVGGDIATASTLITDAIQEITGKRIDSQLPDFCDRPITEEGWELVRDCNSLFGRKQQMTLLELSRSLYGELDLEREVEAWISFYCSRDTFSKEIDRVRNKICNVLRQSCRLADGYRVFAHVRGLLNAGAAAAARQGMDRVEEALEEDVTFRRLQPESLSLLFSDVTLHYNMALKSTLEEKITQGLLDECETLMKAELTKARNTIQQSIRDLNEFCPAEDILTETEYTWPQLCDISDSLIVTSVPGWDRDAFDDLSMRVPGVYLAAWLMGRELHPQMRGATGFSYTHPTDLNSGDTVAAVYGEPLPNGGV